MTLSLSGVAVGYDGPVVSGVDLTVEAGEVVCLLGPNGVGKSTLLKTLVGIQRPLAGEVRVDGTDVAGMARDDLARRVGYVPQQEARQFSATVFETVMMGRRPYIGWRPSEEDERIVADSLARLDIEELSMRDVTELSGGQRQQVQLARALAQQPDAFVLDEPTSDLDVNHEVAVLETVRALADSGKAVCLSMHDLSGAGRVADRFVLLGDGEVVASGGRDVLTAETIESVYGIEVTVQQSPFAVFPRV